MNLNVVVKKKEEPQTEMKLAIATGIGTPILEKTRSHKEADTNTNKSNKQEATQATNNTS